MNFVLYRLLFRKKASQRLEGLIDSIRSALPELDPSRVQPLAAFEPPQQGVLICYPQHQPEAQKLVRGLLRKNRIPFEEHALGPQLATVPERPEDRLEQKARCLESGRFFVHLGHHEEALPLLRRAVELDPACVESAQYLVSVLRNLRRGAEAEPLLYRALEEKPDTAAFNLLLGTHYMDANRLDEAVAQFKAGIAKEPRAAVLYCQLGISFYKQGKLEEALTAFEEAQQRGGEDIPAVQSGLGEVLLEMGRLEEAAQLFNKSLQREPEAREARLKLGWCYYHLGLLDDAEVSFLSVAHEPNDPYWAAARFSLGRLYLERGSMELAAQVLEEVLETEPEFAEAHRFLAEASSLLGEHEKALKHWLAVERIEPDRSLSLQPSLAVCYSRLGLHEQAEASLYGCLDRLGPHPYLFQLLATVLMAQEQWGKAREALKVAERLDPESAATHFEIAWVEENMGNVEEARDRYNRVLRLDPEFVEAYSGLGWLYLQENQLDVALVLFERCLELRGTDPDLLDTVGWVHLLKGDPWKALELFARATDEDPLLGLARAHRAAALVKLGQTAEAQRELVAALQLEPDDEEVLAYAREVATEMGPLTPELKRLLRKRRKSRVSPKVGGNRVRVWDRQRIQEAASDPNYWEDFPAEDVS